MVEQDVGLDLLAVSDAAWALVWGAVACADAGCFNASAAVRSLHGLIGEVARACAALGAPPPQLTRDYPATRVHGWLESRRLRAAWPEFAGSPDTQVAVGLAWRARALLARDQGSTGEEM